MRRLVYEAGGPAEWARRFGGTRWGQPQVSQWISELSPKGIGHRLARDLELAMGLASGALDRPPSIEGAAPSQSARLDVEKLTGLLETVELAVARSRKQVPASTKAKLVAALYADEQASAAGSAEAVQAALASILATMESIYEPPAAR